MLRLSNSLLIALTLGAAGVYLIGPLAHCALHQDCNFFVVQQTHLHDLDLASAILKLLDA